MSLNVPRVPLLSPLELIDSLKTSRLNPFYCTRCGTYHDAITPCPRYEDDVHNKHSYYYDMYGVDTYQYSRKSLLQNNAESSRTNSDTFLNALHSYKNCQIITAPCNYCSPSTSKCVTFDIQNSCKNEIKPCKKYVQDKCVNFSCDSDLKSYGEDKYKNVSCDTDLNDLTQGTETVVTNEQGTDSFDNDYSLFEHLGWSSVHERLHAGYTYGGIILPAITEIEQTQILEDKAPPGPWSKDGKMYSKRIIKLTYPPNSKMYHKRCKGRYGNRKPVPAWMGWLWNASDECMTGKYPFRPDWRPGAMNYKIARMIKRHRGGYEEIEKPKRKPKKRKREEDENIRPMIIIMKRQGCYLITMNPIANPYVTNDKNLECAPIHFIVDQRKCRVELVKRKPKCDCNCECECEDNAEDKESEIRMPNVTSEEEDGEDDEFELEFTPPICLVDHETMLKKKHNKEEKSTQTEAIVLQSKVSSPKKGKGKSSKGKK